MWMRKARSVVGSVKSEIDRELQLEDLRQTLQEKRRLESKALDYLSRDALDALPAKAKAPPVPESAAAVESIPPEEPARDRDPAH